MSAISKINVRFSRKTGSRAWYGFLVALWLVPFALASIAVAEEAFVTPDATGQGWFWKSRPRNTVDEQTVEGGGQNVSVGGDLYCYQVPGGSPCTTNWKLEHMYVGWDGANFTAEMISGINFDLESIPSGSMITRFIMTIYQHPSGDGHNNTPNYEQPLAHGIVACPWPEFFGGSHAAYLDPETKSQRKCGEGVAGVPQISGTQTPESRAARERQLADPARTTKWVFDLSGMAGEWAGGTNPAISLEPQTPSGSGTSWITSFHMDTLFHAPTPEGKTRNASAQPVPDPPQPGDFPGVFAQVTYQKGLDEVTESIEGSFGASEGLDDSSLSFGDSSGLAEDLGETGGEPAEPVDPAQTPLTAGVFEGRPAKFWSIPIWAWLAGLLGFGLIGAAGTVVQAEPGGGRPPGAASALMRKVAASRH